MCMSPVFFEWVSGQAVRPSQRENDMRRTWWIALVIGIVALGAGAENHAAATEESASLEKQLEAKKEGFAETAPQEIQNLYAQGVKDVAATGIEARALGVGDKAPDFTLPEARGETVRLYDLLEEGPVVLTWYRGGWCPYCNLELAAYQQMLDEFEAAGVQLVAISPELPDKSLTTAEKQELSFKVLSDTGNKAARKYNIVFELPKPIAENYSGFFDFEEVYGDTSHELPLPATYVVDRDGIIRYAFAKADYTLRAEPSKVLAIVKSLEKAQ